MLADADRDGDAAGRRRADEEGEKQPRDEADDAEADLEKGPREDLDITASISTETIDLDDADDDEDLGQSEGEHARVDQQQLVAGDAKDRSSANGRVLAPSSDATSLPHASTNGAFSASTQVEIELAGAPASTREPQTDGLNDLEAGLPPKAVKMRPESLTFEQFVQTTEPPRRADTRTGAVQEGDEEKVDLRKKSDTAASLSNDRAFLADSALPQTKLEVLSRQGTWLMIMLFAFASVFGITLSTYIIVTARSSMSKVPGIIAIEGFVLLLTSLILFFLVVSFPQRIIVRKCKKQRILPQQVLLILLIVYLALIPDYGIPTTIMYWMDYHNAVSRANSVGLVGDKVFVYLATENDATANAASQLSISLLLFFWASMLRIAGYYSSSIELRLKQLKLRGTKKPKHRAYILNASAQDDETLDNGVVSDADQPSDFEEVDSIADPEEAYSDEDTAYSESDDGLLRRSRKSRMEDYVNSSKRGRLADRRRRALEEDTLDPELQAVVIEKKKRLAPVRHKLQEGFSRFITSVRAGFKAVRAASKEMSLCSCYYCCCCFICCSYKRCVSQTSIRGVLRRGMAWRLLGALMLYTIIFAVIEDIFDYTCSLVPFVGMITVFRVCAASDPDGNGYCSAQVYPEAFSRSIATTVLFLIEAGIFAWLGNISRWVHRRMAAVPYALNRPNYLGVAFTQVSISAFWLVIFVLALLELTIPSVMVFVERPRFNYTEDAEFVTVTFVVDPLYTVGITSSAATFSSLGLCVSVWVFIITYAWLPADSSRLKGWFVGTPPTTDGLPLAHGNLPDSGTELSPNPFDMIKGERLETILERYFDENPVLISSEHRFRRIFVEQYAERPAGKQHESRKMMLQATGISSRLLFEPAAFETLSSGDLLGGSEGACLRRGRSRADSAASIDHSRTSRNRIVQRQLLSHVFVVETEIALFNFAALTYKIGLEAWQKTPKAVAALVASSPEYTLLGHLVDPTFDTHVVVAKSADRVIVAFRGTVSSLNIDTDLDLNLTPYPLASKVKPLPSTTPLERSWSEKEPTVHRGFLRAYAGVRERLHALIDPLIMPEEGAMGASRQRRALLCTGHSLGGALAVVCAFDFACALDEALNHAERPAVGCTTFGCPRIGSFSFLKRFRRMVPATKRFVLMSDIIPKTPPRLFKSTYDGYHHIGIELLLDLNGNLLISAHSVERAILHGFRRVNSRMHFCSRYSLGLVLWCARMKIDPDLWPIHINDMLKYAKADILSRHQDLFQASYGVFMKEGVISDLFGAVPRRNMGTQATPEDIASETERLSLLASRNEAGTHVARSDFASELAQLSVALSHAIAQLDEHTLAGDRDPDSLSLQQLQTLQRLVREAALRTSSSGPSLRRPQLKPANFSTPTPSKGSTAHMPSLSEAHTM